MRSSRAATTLIRGLPQNGAQLRVAVSQSERAENVESDIIDVDDEVSMTRREAQLLAEATWNVNRSEVSNVTSETNALCSVNVTANDVQRRGRISYHEVFSDEGIREARQRHVELMQRAKQNRMAVADALQRSSEQLKRSHEYLAQHVSPRATPTFEKNMPCLSSQIQRTQIDQPMTEPAKQNVVKSVYPLMTPADFYVAGRLPAMTMAPQRDQKDNGSSGIECNATGAAPSSKFSDFLTR